jgi:hypothetical protein
LRGRRCFRFRCRCFRCRCGSRRRGRGCFRLPLRFELLLDSDLPKALRGDELGVDLLALFAEASRGARLLLARRIELAKLVRQIIL